MNPACESVRRLFWPLEEEQALVEHTLTLVLMPSMVMAMPTYLVPAIDNSFSGVLNLLQQPRR